MSASTYFLHPHTPSLSRSLFRWLPFALATSLAAQVGPPPTITIDSSEFLDTLPRGHRIADASTLGVPWVYYNHALVLKNSEPVSARINIPEAGRYKLWVRSLSRDPASIRVAVNGRADAVGFGKVQIGWQGGGIYALQEGVADLQVTTSSMEAAFDVLVLTQDADFDPEDVVSSIADEVALHHEFQLPPVKAVKFGDLDGDRRNDLVALTADFSAIAIDHEGKELWRYTAPEENAKLRNACEPPGVMWDFDGDGRTELAHWRSIDGKDHLVIADGKTGAIRFSAPWPCPPQPHAYNNFRLVVAKLAASPARELIAFSDTGFHIGVCAFDGSLKPLWSWAQPLKKDHLGHHIYSRDLTGDGIDEIIVGHVCLDAAGNEIWNNIPLHLDPRDHCNGICFADLDGDGKLEAVGAQSDSGIVVRNALTGERLWKQAADHAQQVSLMKTADGLRVLVGGRVFGNPSKGEAPLGACLYGFTPAGEQVFRWPRSPINGDPVIVRGDWRGDGTEEVFWYKYRLDEEGRGILCFYEEVYQMFDFLNNGAEQVIALNRQRGVLQIYGSRSAPQVRTAVRDPEYRRQSIANPSPY